MSELEHIRQTQVQPPPTSYLQEKVQKLHAEIRFLSKLENDISYDTLNSSIQYMRDQVSCILGELHKINTVAKQQVINQRREAEQ